jgi:demethylmenaquinone methyltransferase/2-methoxy-6-polyprenyl-1,4-benzoquinol methylase
MNESLPNYYYFLFFVQYSFNVIPALGELVMRDRAAYQYLVESIRKFPDQPAFAAMLRSAGFRGVSFTNFTLGVAAVHSGFKLPALTPLPQTQEQETDAAVVSS